MQDYSWKRMECNSVLARFNEFSLSDQQRNPLKLKNLASFREFVRDELHIPSLKEEETRNEGSQRWLGRTKGSAILPWIPFVLFFSVLDRRCCASYLGERSPPHLFLYLLYSKEKQEWKQEGTLPGLNTGESKLY